jgi:hypothetical protein
MWVYWKRLTAAIDVTDASMDFLRATPKVVVIPIFYAIAQIIFTLFWMWIFASIISMQKIIPLEIQGFKIPMAKTFEWESSVITMAIYLVFALYWVTSYLDYECQFIIMVATCSFYFNSGWSKEENKYLEGKANVPLGFKAAWYHKGSIAFGSFFVALV